MALIGQEFPYFVKTYRRPDGSKWGGQELHNATGGVATRSYVTSLRKGRVENPGYEKLAAIAKAIGLPPELWFEEGAELDQGARVVELPDDRQSLSERVNGLFEAIKNERTGEPYTNAEIARMSLGDLTEEEVEGIRNGTVSNPSVAQVMALANVFGVQPSYFLDRGKKPLPIDAEAIEIPRDETDRALATIRDT